MYIQLSLQTEVKGGLIDSKPFRRKHRTRYSFHRQHKPSSLKNLDGKNLKKKVPFSPISNLRLDMTFHCAMFPLAVFHLYTVDNSRIPLSNCKLIQAQGVGLFP